MTAASLRQKPVRDLARLAKQHGVAGWHAMRKDQLIRALVLETFDAFPRELIRPLPVVTFTQYEKGLPVDVAFPPESLDGLLGQVVSEAGLRQFRTAETEKYPHVTYFMNGGIEQAFPGEDRHLVPSPRVATYDQEIGRAHV